MSVILVVDRKDRFELPMEPWSSFSLVDVLLPLATFL